MYEKWISLVLKSFESHCTTGIVHWRKDYPFFIFFFFFPKYCTLYIIIRKRVRVYNTDTKRRVVNRSWQRRWREKKKFDKFSRRFPAARAHIRHWNGVSGPLRLRPRSLSLRRRPSSWYLRRRVVDEGDDKREVAEERNLDRITAHYVECSR